MSTIEAGLTVFANVLTEIKDASIDIMKIHPLNSLVMLNLISNLGYALMQPEDKLVFVTGGIATGSTGIAETFETRQELVAAIFKMNAERTGLLLGTQAAAELFKGFSLGKLIG